MTKPMVHFDKEVKSGAPIDWGRHRFLLDKDADFKCMSWAINSLPTKLWLPGMPVPAPFLSPKDYNFSAFNIQFDQLAVNIIGPRYGFKPIPLENCHDVMAVAARYGLPQSLDKLGKALGVEFGKLSTGKALVKLFCTPPFCNPKKDALWHQQQFRLLCEYCMRDVDSMREIQKKMPAPYLSDDEQAIWLENAKMNAIGVPVDHAAVVRINQVVDHYREVESKKVPKITEGVVDTVNQTAKIKEWCADKGVELENLQAQTVADVIEGFHVEPFDEDVLKLLKLRQALGGAAVKKFKRLLNMTVDGRIYDNSRYHGAGTGRTCLHPDHEVLTPLGWVRLDEWSDGAIMCWTPNGELSFQRSVANAFEYSGPMYDIESARIEARMIPNHKVVYRTSRGKIHVDYVKNYKNGAIPISGKFRAGAGDSIVTRLMVAIQADGSICTDKSAGRGLSFSFVKLRKVGRCLAILNIAGIPYRVKKYPSRPNYTTIKVSWSDLPKTLRSAKQFDSGVLMHDPAVFIDELRYWDSHVQGKGKGKGFEYYTTNKKNAEWAQTMAHLAGKAASIRVRDLREKGWSDCYRVYVRDKRSTRVVAKEHIRLTPYEGRVYCPTTPTKFFLTRYKGTIHVTHNTGGGFQMLNMPRNKIKPMKDETYEEAVEKAVQSFYDTSVLKAKAPLEVAKALVRPMIKAKKSKVIMAADWSSIEYILLMWFAGESEKVERFRKGFDPYIDFATKLFKVEYEDVTDEQRQQGKPPILGGGYMLGAVGLVEYASGYGVTLTLEESKVLTNMYRNDHPRVKKAWYALKNCAHMAVQNHGVPYGTHKTKFKVIYDNSGTHWLQMTLPSGRSLYYCKPRLSVGKYGPAIKHMGVDPVNKQWTWVFLKPMRIIENIIQGLGRDVLNAGLVRLGNNGYVHIADVYDEVICEEPEESAQVRYEQMIRHMCVPPTWGPDIPLFADGFIAKRYKKG